ncbi:hypothetical protein Hanom_Chr05g00395091 [Helianthus anomalus]
MLYIFLKILQVDMDDQQAARGRGCGRGAPAIDLLPENTYLVFESDTEAFHRCEKLRQMEVGAHVASDWSTLEEVQEVERA